MQCPPDGPARPLRLLRLRPVTRQATLRTTEAEGTAAPSKVQEDPSVVWMHEDDMEALELYRGDSVILQGARDDDRSASGDTRSDHFDDIEMFSQARWGPMDAPPALSVGPKPIQFILLKSEEHLAPGQVAIFRAQAARLGLTEDAVGADFDSTVFNEDVVVSPVATGPPELSACVELKLYESSDGDFSASELFGTEGGLAALHAAVEEFFHEAYRPVTRGDTFVMELPVMLFTSSPADGEQGVADEASGNTGKRRIECLIAEIFEQNGMASQMSKKPASQMTSTECDFVQGLPPHKRGDLVNFGIVAPSTILEVHSELLKRKGLVKSARKR